MLFWLRIPDFTVGSVSDVPTDLAEINIVRDLQPGAGVSGCASGEQAIPLSPAVGSQTLSDPFDDSFQSVFLISKCIVLYCDSIRLLGDLDLVPVSGHLHDVAAAVLVHDVPEDGHDSGLDIPPCMDSAKYVFSFYIFVFYL